jgi:hypothetical protein
MRLLRTMMALVIALSVAMLPAAGLAASVVKSTSQATSGAMTKHMAMRSDMPGAMDECCPDHVKGKPCNQPSDQCPLACCCAGQPLSLASTAILRFDVPMIAGSPLPIPVDQVVSLHSGSPPFRPPRV